MLLSVRFVEQRNRQMVRSEQISDLLLGVRSRGESFFHIWQHSTYFNVSCGCPIRLYALRYWDMTGKRSLVLACHFEPAAATYNNLRTQVFLPKASELGPDESTGKNVLVVIFQWRSVYKSQYLRAAVRTIFHPLMSAKVSNAPAEISILRRNFRRHRRAAIVFSWCFVFLTSTFLVV